MIYTMQTGSQWQAFIHALRHGERCEVTYEVWEHFLESVPPRFQNRYFAIDGETRHVDFGTGEGGDPTTYFWRNNYKSNETRYFCQEACARIVAL